MKKLFNLFLLLLLTLHLSAQGWKRTFGGGEEDQCEAVVQAIDGGYFLVGYSQSFGTDGDMDIYVIRLDGEGNQLWSNFYDEGFVEQAYSAIPTEDGGLIVAGENRTTQTSSIDAYLLKINAFGEQVWSKSFGGVGTEKLLSLAASNDGGVIAVGYVESVQAGNRDVFVLKTNALGEEIWRRTIGSTEDEEAKSVIALEDGYMLAGYINNRSTNNRDAYVVKISKIGEFSWSKTYGTSSSFEEATCLAKSHDGNVLVAGNKGVSDFYLLKITQEGMTIWENRYGDRSEEFCESITVNEDGSILLSGSIAVGTVNTDIHLIKLNPEGSMQWKQNYGDEEWSDFGKFVIPTEDGGYAIAGSTGFIGNVFNFINDFILVKTDSLGNIRSNRIEGRVYFDNNNCTYTATDDVNLRDWLIRIKNRVTGDEYYTVTDEDGRYSVVTDLGTHTVSVLVNNENYWTPCWNDLTRVFTTTYDTIRAVDFPIKADLLCPYVEVDISAPSLSACQSVDYTVSYSNIGSGVASQVFVDVKMDGIVQLNSATLNYTELGDNTYRFEIGDLAIGAYNQFKINASLPCEGYITGQTHQIRATIPNSFACLEPDPDWDKSSLDVDGDCDAEDGKVNFVVSNKGEGDMVAKRAVRVIQEDVVVFSIFVRLPVEQDTLISLDAMGETFRVVAEQSEGHPGRSFPTVAIEGCGTDSIGNISTGFVSLFSEDDQDPFLGLDVQESMENATGTFLRSSPKGYDDANFVETGRDITYHIQFQNTGNEILRHVVIRDTLPEGLDLKSVMPGASSHPYEFEIYSNRIIKFTFKNLMIPSINKDEVASKGFIKFSISQLPNLKKGTVITNRALVAYNFEKPVVTNSVQLTIGGKLEDFVTFGQFVSTQDQLIKGVNVVISPNPFTETALFELEGWESGAASFRLFDGSGKLLRQEQFSGNQLLFNKKALATGLYFYQIEADGVKLDSGKVIIE